MSLFPSKLSKRVPELWYAIAEFPREAAVENVGGNSAGPSACKHAMIPLGDVLRTPGGVAKTVSAF